ncbi:MAG: SAF domain-containing protein [Nocardioidaceae bacterium]
MRKPPPDDGSARTALRTVRRAVLAHRRLVAACCAGLAVFASLSALRPPDPPTSGVVVATRDLASGATLTSADVEVREIPVDDVAAHAYASTDDVVGEVVGAPMRRGESITDMRLLASDLLSGYPDGATLATVRIADPQSLWGVEVGTIVDIVGVDIDGKGAGQVVAADARVVAMPATDTEDAAVSTGAVLVVSVPSDTAVSLTDASSRMQLGVVVSGSEPVTSP